MDNLRAVTDPEHLYERIAQLEAENARLLDIATTMQETFARVLAGISEAMVELEQPLRALMERHQENGQQREGEG